MGKTFLNLQKLVTVCILAINKMFYYSDDTPVNISKGLIVGSEYQRWALE